MMSTLARPARTPHSPGPGILPRPGHGLARNALGLVLLSAVLVACNEPLTSGGGLTDNVPPTVEVIAATPPSDSTIAFTVTATDNLGLLTVATTASGAGISAVLDTTFHSAVTSFTQTYVLTVPSSVPPGTPVTIIAQATDGAHNESKADTIFIGTGNQPPSVAVITSPTSADTAIIGFSIAIALSGKSPNGVKTLGYIATGVFPSPKSDSVIFGSPLKDSAAVDTALSLVGASSGTLTLTPFVTDSLGRRFLGIPVNVVVSATAPSNTVPKVSFGITPRIEVTDTIHVSASDRAGIRWLGYEVRNLPSDPNTFFAADSLQVSGNVSSTFHTFLMHLNVTTFPKMLQVSAFATNDNGKRQYALLSDGVTIQADTVTVVAGLTKGIPDGGLIADALYHPGVNKLYLTNINLNEIEVFDLSDSTFETNPIITGSRPWGITAWPLDRSGTMSDTLLVANSGGTSISKINVVTGQEFTRYALPHIRVGTVTSTLGKTGTIIQQITWYDFSDRPQYVAATCQGPAVGPAPCGHVILVYSTTPTPGQSVPFNGNNGTVRWEDMSDSTSHFFFEQAMGQTQGQSDSLTIVRFASQSTGSDDSTLVPYLQQTVVAPNDTLKFSVVVQIPFLAFRDTTFVRNSGNFRRAIIGEGGPVLGSRALMYDVTTGMALDYPGTATPLPVPVIDNGISPPEAVSDFIANTYTRVGGAAINFDGELAAIRGDSTYIIDRNLRLQGLLQTSGGNPGFDFHPNNAGIGPNTSPSGTRVGFAASSAPQIEVYDTYTYRRCLIIPTRDPIIGPIKSAVRSGTGDVVLVGATQFGVVIVTVTQAQLSSCQ